MTPATTEAPNLMSASLLADRLKQGELSATEVMDACLDRIAERETLVRAWSFLDAVQAREAAALADRHRAAGLPLGPLHGLPIDRKSVV